MIDIQQLAVREELQNGTQSKEYIYIYLSYQCPVSAAGWGNLGMEESGSLKVKEVSLLQSYTKKPMASDGCDDICGHYWGDKLMDTLQVDGL